MRLCTSMNSRLALPALALAMAGGLWGCGWTPRDEFIHSRQVVLTPRPGDGTRITAQFDSRPGRTPVAALAQRSHEH
jgi:hypothetical protein